MSGESAANVLTLNSGSSSLKFGLYRASASRMDLLLSGAAESIGGANGKFHAEDSAGNALLSENLSISTQQDAVHRIARLLAEREIPMPDIVGHRIVHGGPVVRRHCPIDDTVMAELEAAAAFAPLHTPPALAVVRFAQEHFPETPQFACLDTAFHASLPDIARVLPIAKELQTEGIQRYGFHGLSCESILYQIGGDLPDRVIVAHLGNGASITAIKGGKSIDTSMGLTPAGGVVMGTRSGDLDPGIMLYLMRARKYDADALEELVNRRSGLLGVSGLDSDMRRLHEARPSNADADLAIRMFCYSVRKQIAAMAAALGGLDLLVFTGGIGENDPEVRTEICAGLSWLGVSLDRSQNQAAQNPVNTAESRCSVRVLPSRENDQIARHSWALFRNSADQPRR